ncbi:MAG: hypothetical protein ACOYLU_14750, partial [Limisphaerales bacterium]
MISLFPWLRRGLLLSVLSGCCLVPAVAALESQPDRASNHWSFQKVVRPKVPAGAHPVDAFVQSALKAQGLAPNPPASP